MEQCILSVVTQTVFYHYLFDNYHALLFFVASAPCRWNFSFRIFHPSSFWKNRASPCPNQPNFLLCRNVLHSAWPVVKIITVLSRLLSISVSRFLDVIECETHFPVKLSWAINETQWDKNNGIKMIKVLIIIMSGCYVVSISQWSTLIPS